MKRIEFALKASLAAFFLCLGAIAPAHAQPGPADASQQGDGVSGCPYMESCIGRGMTGSGMMSPGMTSMGPGMGMRPGMMGPGMMGPGMMGHGMGHPHGGMMGMGPSYLHWLQLSEEQQDRIFGIKHRQAPRFRESAKQLHKSMTALHQLTHAGNYSDANAQSLARSIGQASADLALLHAQTERQIYEVLTPEQRRQLEERGPVMRRGPGPAMRPGCAGARR